MTLYISPSPVKKQRAMTLWGHEDPYDLGAGVKASFVAKFDTVSTTQDAAILSTEQVNQLKCFINENDSNLLISDSVNITFNGVNAVGSLNELITKSSYLENEDKIVIGTINSIDRQLVFDNWVAGDPNNLIVNAATVQVADVPVGTVSFRTPVIPIKPDSVQILATLITGEELNLKFNSQGLIESQFAEGAINYQTGLITLFFRKEIDLSNTVKTYTGVGENRQAVYYTVGDNGQYYKGNQIFIKNNLPFGIEPLFAKANTIRFNAKAYAYVPLDPDILGIDTVKLPPSGRVPAYRKGNLIVIKADETTELTDLTLNQPISLGKSRLSFIEVVDSLGVKLPYNTYSVDLDAGKLTLLDGFPTTGYQTPYIANWRYQDMALARDVDISGAIRLTKTLTHNFSAAKSKVSSALLMGTMQARVYNIFTQETWTGKWLDYREGNDSQYKYDTAVSPIVVINKSSLEEDWALVFTSSTAFKLIGKNVGEVATGTTLEDFTPLNEVTGKPLMTIRAVGHANNAVGGNVLRFKTKAANYPVYIARTVLQSNPTSINHAFSLEFQGDKDRII